MWSYYGRKTKVIKEYPKPLHDLIIEPFAGTAVYSLYEENWKRDVIILDKFHKVIKTWWYLQQTTPEDIKKLPILKHKEKTTDYEWLCDEERWLIGFNIARGSARPKTTVQMYNSWNEEFRDRLADSIHKIKHWDIRLGTYEDIENQKATWFIDPRMSLEENIIMNDSVTLRI